MLEASDLTRHWPKAWRISGRISQPLERYRFILVSYSAHMSLLIRPRVRLGTGYYAGGVSFALKVVLGHLRPCRPSGVGSGLRARASYVKSRDTHNDETSNTKILNTTIGLSIR